MTVVVGLESLLPWGAGAGALHGGAVVRPDGLRRVWLDDSLWLEPPAQPHPLPLCNALPRASHHQPTTSPGGLSRPIGKVFSGERGGGIALGRGWGDPAAKSAKPQPIRPKALPTLARTLTPDKRMSGHPVSHQSVSLLGVSIWLFVEGRNMLRQVFTLTVRHKWSAFYP